MTVNLIQAVPLAAGAVMLAVMILISIRDGMWLQLAFVLATTGFLLAVFINPAGTMEFLQRPLFTIGGPN